MPSVMGMPNCCIVRLPDVPANDRIELMRQLLERHADALADGAIATVRGTRIRLARPHE